MLLYMMAEMLVVEMGKDVQFEKFENFQKKISVGVLMMLQFLKTKQT